MSLINPSSSSNAISGSGLVGNTNKNNVDNSFAALLEGNGTLSAAAAVGTTAPASLAPSSTDSTGKAAIDMFLKYAKMTPTERFRAQYLAEHHLTEDQLAKMDPAARQKIETEIANEIKQKMQQTGATNGTGAVGAIAG